MTRNPFSKFEIIRFAAIGAVAAGVLLGTQALCAASSSTPAAAAPSPAPSVATPPAARHHAYSRRGASSWGTSTARLVRALSLSDDQAKQVKGIYDSHQAELTARSQAVKSAHEALQKATVATPMNEQEIRRAAQAAGQAEGDSALLEAKIRAQITVLLNPDQQKKFASYHEGGYGQGRSLFFRRNF